MKKFLSVLLALAVAFTFTFGSTMSAFAAGGYDEATQKSLAAEAASGITAEEYTVDYDGSETGTPIRDINGKDMTVFTITAENAAKAVSEAVAKKYTTSVAWYDDTAYVGDYTVGGNNANSTDLVKVRNLIINDAKNTYSYAAEKAAFDDYKALLTSLVDTVVTTGYSTTEKEGVTVTAMDGVAYKTAKAAAEADKTYAKNVIANAKYDNTVDNSAAKNANEEWKVKSYNDLYTAVFGPIITVKTTTEKDALDNTYTESVSYVLTATYKTTADEANAADDLAYAQMVAKNALNNAIRTYKASPDYVAAKQDAEINAYVAVKTYLIENNTDAIVSERTGKVTGYNFNYSDVELTTPEAYAMDKTEAVKTVYQDRVALAEKQKAKLESAKADATAYGYGYNDEAAQEALVADIIAIYLGEDVPSTNYVSFKVADLTAGQKAANKVDYSEVEAKADIIGSTYNLASATNIAKIDIIPQKYYEAEWTAVKAAIDTYNAAVDAAATSKDVAAAAKAAKEAINAIKYASQVAGAVVNTDFATAVQNYFTATKTEYNLKNTGDIYITWDGETYENAIDMDSVYAWVIDKGARKATETYALLPDAKQVINAYKTAADIQAMGTEVKSQIDALPTKATDVTLADKDAIIAAYNAYAALPDAAKAYVTNVAKLNADVVAVEKLEAASVATLIKALPAENKVTIADKDAVKAAQAAYKAYTDLFKAGEAYKVVVNYPTYNPNSPYKFEGTNSALATIQGLEDDAITAAYKPLKAKYDNNTLTAEDADAVAALKALIDAYIAEYKTSPKAIGVEEYTAKIDAAVAALIAEAEWTATDVKASLFDSSRKLTIWRTSKTSIRVTSVGSVADIKDHGYTVKYKFYKKAPGSSTYKLVKTTTSNKYTYTNLKKGTNKFQAKVCVYDADGKLVASKWTYYRAAKIK